MNLRRPSNDELTPEDLFRPEPAGGPAGGRQPGETMPGEIIRSSPDGLPWNAPAQGQPEGHPEYYGEPAYGEPGYGEVGYGDQGYGPQAQSAAPVQEASTQFMPPFPAAPQPQQPTYGNGYQPAQQGYGQNGYGAPTQAYQQNGYQQNGYDQGGYHQGQDDRPARRFSNRSIGIAVVAGCAVVGIVVAAAVGSSGSSKGATAAGTSSSAAAGSGASSGASVSAGQAQAKAMSDLLATASHSRSAVISAVNDITHCQNLDQAQQNLTAAAGLRKQLVTQLSSMQTDQLQNGSELVTALQQGWKASESADSHYASWAAESKGSCAKNNKPKNGGRNAADEASGTASTAKAKASRLWNAIAAETGLPKLSATEL